MKRELMLIVAAVLGLLSVLMIYGASKPKKFVEVSRTPVKRIDTRAEQTNAWAVEVRYGCVGSKKLRTHTLWFEEKPDPKNLAQAVTGQGLFERCVAHQVSAPTWRELPKDIAGAFNAGRGK